MLVDEDMVVDDDDNDPPKVDCEAAAPSDPESLLPPLLPLSPLPLLPTGD